MNRIICDICGTAYQDSASVCPICGYSRQNTERVTVPEDTAAEAAVQQAAPQEQAAPAQADTSVKGGRFSKKNVKKRVRAAQATSGADKDDMPGGGNGGMKRVALVLLAGVLLVGGYIGFRFWNGRNAYDDPQLNQDNTNTSGTEQTTEQTEPQDTSVACTGIELNAELIDLINQGAMVNLGVTVYPADTTDVITYESSDESVVTVDANGNVTAIAPGSAFVTVYCGDVSMDCMVICSFDEEPVDPDDENTDPDGEPVDPDDENTEPSEEVTEPSEETTEPTETTGTSNGKLTLSKSDVTLRYKGESFSLNPKFNGGTVALASVTWTTSDASVATVENGKVTAVGSGKCTITASYNGSTQSCIVRCGFKDEEETAEETKPTETTEPTEGGTSSGSDWSISKEDVTISVGESFKLVITNSAGEIAQVSWSASTSGVVSVENGTVTGLKSGKTVLSATIDGKTFECIIRVK